jgi:hypothetical protein
MLFGMAIECELKGLLFAEDPTKSYKDHDLKNLADALALTLTMREAELLAILSDHIVWCGRYPAPLKPVNVQFKTDSLVSGSRHSSHTPAIDSAIPSAAVMK